MRNAPLHIACDHGDIFGVKWLVEHNADVNSANEVRLSNDVVAHIISLSLGWPYSFYECVCKLR